MSVSLIYLPTLAKSRQQRWQQKQRVFLWPVQYTNSRTGKIYQPQNEQVTQFIANNTCRYSLLKGGEGGGKSSAGVTKTLARLRRGCSGIMVSPDLEHFKKSLWPIFKEWCPWETVIEKQQYRKQEGWQPSQAFTMVLKNELGGFSELICGGALETEIGAWEGPNVNFVYFDEARRHRTPAAIKTFDGRVRIPGPNEELPQIYLTTTPRKHWLFDYFAGAKGDEQSLPLLSVETQTKYSDFKRDAFVATVLTKENEAMGNLQAGFTQKRAQTLDASEIRILLEASWEDESDIEKFVNLIWWDNCREALPGLTRHEPLILALDAAKGGETNVPDCFAMVGVTRHPGNKANVAVRYCGIWQPQPGQLLDFAPIERELIRLCREFSVLEVAYDPYQLHDMAMRLRQAGIANFKEFNQGTDRLKADKQLQDLIMARRISHDGNPLLRQHVDNANIKKAGQDGIRLVKRSPSLKIDAAVALSMAAARILYYNI